MTKVGKEAACEQRQLPLHSAGPRQNIPAHDKAHKRPTEQAKVGTRRRMNTQMSTYQKLRR